MSTAERPAMCETNVGIFDVLEETLVPEGELSESELVDRIYSVTLITLDEI